MAEIGDSKPEVIETVEIKGVYYPVGPDGKLLKLHPEDTVPAYKMTPDQKNLQGVETPVPKTTSDFVDIKHSGIVSPSEDNDRGQA